MLFVLMGCLLGLNVAVAMTPLTDNEMGDVAGQALLMMDMIQGEAGKSDDYTFYRAGLDAVVELNANFEKLQLGCGGINSHELGPGCDLDIDQMSLTGPEPAGGWTSQDQRAASDAILTRPFFEFAIKNDGTPHREITGFRLSAENAQGQLTAGDQVAGSSDPGNTSGINVMSGYMKLGPTTGVASTDPRPMTYDDYTCTSSDSCEGSYQGLGRQMSGRIFLDTLSIGTKSFKSTGYTMQLSGADAFVEVPTTTVSGKRMTEVDLMGSASIGQISFGGELAVNVKEVILGRDLDMTMNVTGKIDGLTAKVPIEQSLKFIHKINVNSPFSLSMQSDDVWWPEAAVSSQTGWWMAFEDEIDIGEVTPENTVPITNDVLQEAIGPENISWNPNKPRVSGFNGVTCASGPSINCALTTYLTGKTNLTGGGKQYSDGGFVGIGGTPTYHVYGAYCKGLSGCLGGSLDVGTLQVPKQLDFPLEHLKLSGQHVTPNCYGDARFC